MMRPGSTTRYTGQSDPASMKVGNSCMAISATVHIEANVHELLHNPHPGKTMLVLIEYIHILLLVDLQQCNLRQRKISV